MSNAVVRLDTTTPQSTSNLNDTPSPDARPTRQQAEEAIRTLLEYLGQDSGREGLVETPSRVVSAYDEWCAGYSVDPDALLSKTFAEVEGYQDMVLLKDIPFVSRCEHHLAPIVGKAHVAYLPQGRVVGISKLVRVVEAYAKRLQIQERMTQEIVNCLTRGLNPRGVAIMIEAEHHCMTSRGVHTHGSTMTTKRLTGEFDTDAKFREDFFRSIKS